ncbi:VOC family protein, partial [Escherichia coli]
MINHLDHLVLTTTDQNACIDFYTHVLKMKLITFGEQRYALQFG